VEAVQTWLAAAEINDGPVFRPVLKGSRIQASALAAHAVAAIIERYAVRAGLDPASFAGHSLRAGFLTSAAEAGASVFKMMDVSRRQPKYLAPTQSALETDAEAAGGGRVPACDLRQDEGGRCVDYPPRREKCPCRGRSPGGRRIVPIEIRQTLVWSIYRVDATADRRRVQLLPCTNM
jgi:hypothetical protein